MQKTDISNDVFIDPVCWMKVPSGETSVKSMYLMRTYYFCSEDCRKAFELNPESYLKLTSPWCKEWWKLYLKRLMKAPGG
ncbi:MAG: YHS domain-containing protein [Deltaproteobacteria bacterium]|nr:YHS domain-containing protein [Deltaproteobacteria bacterium]MBW1995213.1 YHS domain-containing protein [Deltaproteobacteria bacterium]MBW2150237.1 YHS domain-containing protein [Deltaproteobacteria bacterium]